VVLLNLVLTGCEDPLLSTKDDGVMKDLTGLDGCGWVIELDSDAESPERLEPINLNDFDLEPVDGMKVKISYHESNSGSICMVGKIIELTKIKKK
jgi:hypothetical protein